MKMKINAIGVGSICYPKCIKRVPICSSEGHPTNRISQFIDHYLKNYVPKNRYYIKDRTHFVTQINILGTIPNDTLI
jgi:hypothetical protein